MLCRWLAFGLRVGRNMDKNGARSRASCGVLVGSGRGRSGFNAGVLAAGLMRAAAQMASTIIGLELRWEIPAAWRMAR